MPLLFDDDYAYLQEIGQAHTEDEENRFLILKDFPLPAGKYRVGQEARDAIDVLYAVPENYNTEGGDMFWVNGLIERVDGGPIPNISGPGQDSRTHGGVEYLRWSRHWNEANRKWRPKQDNIRTIIDRLNWAFAYPEAKRA